MDLYSTSHSRCLDMVHRFTCKLHRTCLHLVSVYQMVPPLTCNVDSVYQFLSRDAPGYLADDCLLVVDARVRQLRSANTRTPLSIGHTAVLETGPLPPQDHKSGTVCHPNLRLFELSYGQFRWLMKTFLLFLFGQ